MAVREGFYGDELAARMRRAVAKYAIDKETDPQGAQRNLANECRRAPPRVKGGRPREAVYDRAQALYEDVTASGARPNWREITKAADPSYFALQTNAARRRLVRLVRSAIHSRLTLKKTSVRNSVSDSTRNRTVKT